MDVVKGISEVTKISQKQVIEMISGSCPKIIWKYVMPNSVERELVGNPIVQGIDSFQKARNIFLNCFSDPDSSIVVLTAILAKWVTLCSTTEETLIPCRIAIRKKCFPAEALGVQKFYFLLKEV